MPNVRYGFSFSFFFYSFWRFMHSFDFPVSEISNFISLDSDGNFRELNC